MLVNLSIHLIKQNGVFLIVYLRYVDQLRLGLIGLLSRQRQRNVFFLVFSEMYTVFSENGSKFIDAYLALVVWICCSLEFLDKLVPLSSNSFENLGEYFGCSISMELVMKLAIVLALLRRLKALVVHADDDLVLLRHVLTEVEAL